MRTRTKGSLRLLGPPTMRWDAQECAVGRQYSPYTMINVAIALLALAVIVFGAYRGHSVILLAPFAAMLAVLLTRPAAVPVMFAGVFMDKFAGFMRAYFPVFLLGAIFGKLIDTSGLSVVLVRTISERLGSKHAIAAVVAICALLTYGGVSLFVVVFAVYPFGAALFRQAQIPKRLLPATIALGAFSFTMDSLPGTPQIQNIIPTTFFGTTTWAAPILGTAGAIFVLVAGLLYLDFSRRRAIANSEGYGVQHSNEPVPNIVDTRGPAFLALLPLLTVEVVNFALSRIIPKFGSAMLNVQFSGLAHPIVVDIGSSAAVWAVEGALLSGIVVVVLLGFRNIRGQISDASKAATAGAMLAAVNTASEYGFGGVIAALPGFVVMERALASIGGPLVNEAISVTSLAGMTGSASGGLSLALGAMAPRFKDAGFAAHIPPDVLHRVASMASGGLDTLPHNGAVITLLAVTGLTHRQAYKDIFAITCIKTAAVAVVIALYRLTGLV